MCTESGIVKVLNSATGKTEQYYVILVGVYGDSPATQKIVGAGSATGTFSCKWCVLQSVPIQGASKTTLYPAGYVERTVIDKYHLVDKHVIRKKRDPHGVRLVHAGDDRIKLSDEQQIDRMTKADASKRNESYNLPHFGVKGTNVFTDKLPYTSFNNLWVVPTYHMLLYGVVKGFWTTAFMS